MRTVGRIDPEMTVRQIVEAFPRTHRVFAKFRLDLCCGGAHPVRVAARAHGVDLPALLEELEGAAR